MYALAVALEVDGDVRVGWRSGSRRGCACRLACVVVVGGVVVVAGEVVVGDVVVVVVCACCVKWLDLGLWVMLLIARK